MTKFILRILSFECVCFPILAVAVALWQKTEFLLGCAYFQREANPSSTCLLSYNYEDHPLKNYANELHTTYSGVYSGLGDRFRSQTQYDDNPDCFKSAELLNILALLLNFSKTQFFHLLNGNDDISRHVL